MRSVALMTGRYPYSSGMFSKIGAYDTFGVSLDEAFLPQVLRTAGYQTHAVGKWHLGHSWRQFTPTYRGFQSFFGFLAGGAQGYFDHISETRRDGVVTAAYDMGWEPEEFCNETCSQIVDARGVYSSFLYADKAAEIIEKHDSAEGPLFLYLAYSGK